MADFASDNGNSNGRYAPQSLRLKTGLAEMLKGGVIMDVMSVEQARIAEEAGAVSVMALERVPAMIRAQGGVARMASPKLIKEIIGAVSIPVMAKARIGHFAEAQVLQELGVDFIDESEVLTPADEKFHIDKHAFTTPFVCGAKDLGEALRRIAEGAAMIRTKGEPGTGDVVHAVQHMRQITREIKALTVLGEEELYQAAKFHQAPYELVRMVAKAGKLPVPNFSAGGIATPADAALMMQLGAETVFVGSGIFMKDGADPLRVDRYTEDSLYESGDWYDENSEIRSGDFNRRVDREVIGRPRNPSEHAEAVSRAKAIVLATLHHNDPKMVAEASEAVLGSMKGLAAAAIEESQRMQTRGW
ncbi:pyridoxal 5'-phosphate synthase lyase subunit PdxS [Terriglobus sp.]|uniref:pyridoxal 5'-phosphate synthase lyase subunit PdxS n=1 Tax=Terriglobus sp. TaxID=1889013 RepID=UPI003B00ADC6